MAWNAPITWVDGTRYVAADFNAQFRDNLLMLRGGGIAITSQAANDFIYATSTTQFGRLTAVEGQGPVFSSGAWTMAASSGSGADASFVIAAESFG